MVQNELTLLIWSSFNPFSRQICREKGPPKRSSHKNCFYTYVLTIVFSVKLNISSYWPLSLIFKSNTDRSPDLKFLFDKEKSLRSILSIVIILEFHNRKSKEKVLLAFWLAVPKWNHTNVRMNWIKSFFDNLLIEFLRRTC